jgi:hypothetical protein
MSKQLLKVEGFGEEECFIDEHGEIFAPDLAPERMRLDGDLMIQTMSGAHTLQKDDLTNRIATALAALVKARGGHPYYLVDMAKMTNMEISARKNATQTYEKLGVGEMLTFGATGMINYLVMFGAQMFSKGFIKQFGSEREARAWVAAQSK